MKIGVVFILMELREPGRVFTFPKICATALRIYQQQKVR